jgi:site-specific DNA-methyltransferase (adenine-specific)
MNKFISEVTNEDCMEGMARYPDKYFDLAIVDPPYGIGASKQIAVSCIKYRQNTFVKRQK